MMSVPFTMFSTTERMNVELTISETDYAAELDRLRHAIDDIDAAICRLIIERRQYSQSATRVRIMQGKGTVDLNRESEILGTYRLFLGHGALHIADNILHYSKASSV